MTRLGCASEYQAQITEYMGSSTTAAEDPDDVSSTVIGELTGITSLEWGRRLSDTSVAEVRIAKSSTMRDDCCGLWRKFQPWWNDLIIYRDGEVVWRGPVYRMRERQDSFVVQARDITAWLDKRSAYRHVPIFPETWDGSAVIDWVMRAINLVLPTTPTIPEFARPTVHELISLYFSGRTIGISPDSWLDSAMHAENLRELMNLAQDLVPWVTWTQSGNRIYIRPIPTYETTPTAVLTREHFSTDLETIVDGEPMVTFVGASGDVKTGTAGETFVHDEYVHRPVVAGGKTLPPLALRVFMPDPMESATHIADLQALANHHADLTAPPIVYTQVPSGSKLTPDAPVSIRELFCGARIDVYSDACWRARPNAYADQASPGTVLAGVDVSWSPDDGESVGITLVPLDLAVS